MSLLLTKSFKKKGEKKKGKKKIKDNLRWGGGEEGIRDSLKGEIRAFEVGLGICGIPYGADRFFFFWGGVSMNGDINYISFSCDGPQRAHDKA